MLLPGNCPDAAHIFRYTTQQHAHVTHIFNVHTNAESMRAMRSAVRSLLRNYSSHLCIDDFRKHRLFRHRQFADFILCGTKAGRGKSAEAAGTEQADTAVAAAAVR